MFLKRIKSTLKIKFFLVAAGFFIFTFSYGNAQQRGGVINVATIGEPPTLDAMVSTADLVGMISQHIFETLYTFDADWKPTPLLAAALPEISAGGKIYTIKLREDIKFHDGTIMTAADVVASLTRWTQLASRGKQAATIIEEIATSDEVTVQIRLREPHAPLVALLAFNNSAAIILPATKQAEPMSEFIGTGPYKLQERRPDQYIQLVRFDDYLSPTGESSLYGGARHQYVDEIRFVPVPDASTRVEAAISGQYDYIDSIPVESYVRLTDEVASEPIILESFGWPVFVFNTGQGIAQSKPLRQAVQMALNEADMLAAAFGSEDFYTVEGALYPQNFVWHTQEGVEGRYNVADLDQAKELLAEVDYDGSPLRILTSRQYEFHYKMAQVAAEYLKLAGFSVDLQVVDWATLTQRRADPSLWDIYITHSPFLPEPSLIGIMSTSAPGRWDTPQRAQAFDAFNAEIDMGRRVKLWARVQNVFMDEVPAIKIGNFNAVAAKSKTLQGVVSAPWPYFWNVSLQQ